MTRTVTAIAADLVAAWDDAAHLNDHDLFHAVRPLIAEARDVLAQGLEKGDRGHRYDSDDRCREQDCPYHRHIVAPAILAAAPDLSRDAEVARLEAENERLRVDLATFTAEPDIRVRLEADRVTYWYNETRLMDAKAERLRAARADAEARVAALEGALSKLMAYHDGQECIDPYDCLYAQTRAALACDGHCAKDVCTCVVLPVEP